MKTEECSTKNLCKMVCPIWKSCCQEQLLWWCHYSHGSWIWALPKIGLKINVGLLTYEKRVSSVWLYEGKGRELYLPKWKMCLVPDYQYPNNCLRCPAFMLSSSFWELQEKKWRFSSLRDYRRNSLMHVVSCKKYYAQAFKWFIVVTVFSLKFLCNYSKITICIFFIILT